MTAKRISAGAVLLGCCALAAAQGDYVAKGCQQNISEQAGARVRKIGSNVRYYRFPARLQPTRATRYSPEYENQLKDAVSEELRRDKANDGADGAAINYATKSQLPIFELRQATTCVHLVKPEICQAEVGQPACVDIEVSSYAIHAGDDVLAQAGADAAAGLQTIFAAVPAPLLALNPKIGLEYAPKFGLAQSFAFHTDVGAVARISQRKPIAAATSRFVAEGQYRRGLDTDNYETRTRLVFEHLRKRTVDKLRIEAGLDATGEPQGTRRVLQTNPFLAGEFRLKVAKTTDLLLRTGLLRRHVRESCAGSQCGADTATAWNSSAGISRPLGYGALQARASFETSSSDRLTERFQRGAAALEYHGEVGRGHQTFGIDAAVAAGVASQVTPSYAQFYAGAEEERAAALRRIAPVLRSAGSGEIVLAGGRGATQFTSVNATVAVPIRRWSRPLIPEEVDEDGRTLADIIKKGAGSGVSFLSIIYRNQGLTPEQARERAQRELDFVRPAISRIVDQANLYSIRPLLLTDAVWLRAPGDSGTAVAVGAGVRVSLVTANLDVAYTHTVQRSRLLISRRGAASVRLSFHSFF